MMDLNKMLYKAIIASYKASKEIISVRDKGLTNLGTKLKIDKSFVTDADIKANDAIISVLSSTDIPIISEESEKPKTKNKKYVWIVDPLDGTSEFVDGGDEFTVNIALVENGEIVLGVVYVPVLKHLYFAHKDIGSYKYLGEHIFHDESLRSLIHGSYQLPLQNIHKEKYTVVASRRNLDPATRFFIENLVEGKDVDYIKRSSSLKFCMIAEGTADIYPRFGSIYEWDIAASHAIVKYANKNIYTLEGEEMKYNKNDLLTGSFIAK